MASTRRRSLAAGAVILGLAFLAPRTWADTYPSKPIRLIVPSAPGGSPDILARLIAPELGKTLGQSVVVEDIFGAAGIIGTDKVAKADPDGYTLLYGFNQVVTMNPPLYPRLPYQPERDLEPISITLNLSYVWIATPNFAPATVAQWIALAKKEPGRISYASTGNGSAAHLGGALMERMADIKMLHVPYKGNTNSDLIGGVVQLKLDPIAASISLIKAGQVKALAVSSPQRLAVLPDVPTVAETVPGYQMVGWQGVWAPKGTPAPIIARLNAALVKVVHTPAISQRIADLGYETRGTSPQEMAQVIRDETAQWTSLIKAQHISLEQ